MRRNPDPTPRRPGPHPVTFRVVPDTAPRLEDARWSHDIDTARSTNLPLGQPGPTGGGPRVTREDVRNLDRLRRTTGANKYVAGVAGGVARHFDIDPAIVRVLFVVLTFFGGTGLMLYGALWLLLPEDDGDQAIINLDSRSLTFALLAVLVFGAVLLVGDSWGGYGFPWPLTVIGLVVAVVLLSRDRKNPPAPPPVSYTPYVPGAVPSAAAGEQATDTATTADYQAPPAYPAYPVLPPGYQPPTGAWQPPPAPPRPANPRKRGPILFWFTMALAALGVGILGVVDVSGADVPWSAYPALVLAVTGLMLLVGAFFGRAGGLILVGLLAAVATAGGTVGERFDGDVLTSTPASAAAVQDTYDFEAGELILDLSQVADPENLDGRTIHIDGDLGRIEVLVPDDVDVQVDAFVDGLGDTSVFGSHDDGFEPRIIDNHDVRDEVAAFSLEADLSVGEIVVHTAPERHPMSTYTDYSTSDAEPHERLAHRQRRTPRDGPGLPRPGRRVERGPARHRPRRRRALAAPAAVGLRRGRRADRHRGRRGPALAPLRCDAGRAGRADVRRAAHPRPHERPRREARPLRVPGGGPMNDQQPPLPAPATATPLPPAGSFVATTTGCSAACARGSRTTCAST